MSEFISLSEQAENAANTREGIILISGDGNSGKSTTVNLLADAYHSSGPDNSVFTVDFRNLVIRCDDRLHDFPEFLLTDEIRLDTETAWDFERSRLEQWGIAFKSIFLPHGPWVLIVDDAPDWIIPALVQLADSGVLVIASIRSESSSDAIMKVIGSFAKYTGHQDEDIVRRAVAVSIWQKLIHDKTTGKASLISNQNL